jgi:hypothetical protein
MVLAGAARAGRIPAVAKAHAAASSFRLASTQAAMRAWQRSGYSNVVPFRKLGLNSSSRQRLVSGDQLVLIQRSRAWHQSRAAAMAAFRSVNASTR